MFDEIENGATRFQRVADKVRMPRFGGDCYSYVLLALGQVDLVVEADLKIYDVAALIPLIRAAGGVITDWEGGSPELGGAIVAAATPQLHAEALALLRNE
jgi:fructose-1,6-bisphosphatase/inositol monophosphatase family enzyme